MNKVHLTVDGRVLEAPQGATLLQVMLDAGMDIPHYCYHPKLSIDGSCRLCQVKIEGMPKLQISCNTQVRDGMVVNTQDPEIAEVRRGVLELLLLNHPLDCPICDKAGECWLQNYSMRFGSRFCRTVEPRRKHGKRLDIGERMILDQERCILCRRCVRFCREITKTGELRIFNLGDRSLLDIYDRRLDNDYSICTADICPVGALESKDFHHRLRVWFLDETASVCPSCANGCNIMVHTYQGKIWRLTPRRNDAVNSTWMCDHGRLNYRFVGDSARLRTPQVAGAQGLRPASFEEALGETVRAIEELRAVDGGQALGAVVSPHLTTEENFRFGELLRALGVKRVAMAVRRGNSDDLLVKAEKAPNARGVRELGLTGPPDDGLQEMLAAIENGTVKGLYLCGDDLLDVVSPKTIGPLLGKLELLIAQVVTLRPELSRARVVLPTTTFAEKDGTFTNHAGRVQRINRALETPPEWLGDGEIFTRLLNTLAQRRDNFELGSVWQAIGRDHNAFAQLAFDALGPSGLPLSGAGEMDSRGGPET